MTDNFQNKNRLKDICAYRHAMGDMAFKQLKAKYAGSVLGVSWAVINPLLITASIVFVFSVVFKVEIHNFSLFVLCAMFPWMFFAGAISEATTSILAQQGIMRQFNMPREILPLASVLSNFLNYLIGGMIILPIFFWANPKAIASCLWLAPLLVLYLFFIAGLGLIFSVANVCWRDVGNLVNVLLMFWMWVTPVFYASEMVPDKFRWVVDVNPMTPYMIFYRDVLFWARPPDVSTLAGVVLWAVFTFFLGLIIFSRLEPQLLKRV